MSRILSLVGKELREALPATIFFLFLFHLLGITKAVLLQEYSFTALRSVGATMGALIVAKAVLIVETLTFSHLFSNRRIYNILWRTLLYTLIALLFKFLEELIPYISKHGELLTAIRDLMSEHSWALFGVESLWLLFALFFYTLARDLIRLVGLDQFKHALFSPSENRSEPNPNDN